MPNIYDGAFLGKELAAKTVNGFRKKLHHDIWQGYKYACKEKNKFENKSISLAKPLRQLCQNILFSINKYFKCLHPVQFGGN